MVVEAELDALLVDQFAGDHLGVIGLGSATAKPDAGIFKILKKASVVLLSIDRDPAGEKAIKWWMDHMGRVEHWPVTAGKDPGEAYQSGKDIRLWALAGLRIDGRSSLDNKKTEAEDPIPEPAEKAGTGIGDESSPERPASVEEFVELLKKHPVEIRITNRRTQIQEDKTWAGGNPEASKRISELVFFDDDVGSLFPTMTIRRSTVAT